MYRWPFCNHGYLKTLDVFCWMHFWICQLTDLLCGIKPFVHTSQYYKVIFLWTLPVKEIWRSSIVFTDSFHLIRPPLKMAQKSAHVITLTGLGGFRFVNSLRCWAFWRSRGSESQWWSITLWYSLEPLGAKPWLWNSQNLWYVHKCMLGQVWRFLLHICAGAGCLMLL